MTDRQSNNFRLSNQKILLTYKTHIDKETLISRIRDIVSSQCKEIRFMRVAHETADEENPYEHTHMVCDFGKAFQSRNARIFDIDGIHPHINPIKTIPHFENAKEYLSKEDPDNQDLKKTSIVSSIWNCESLPEAMLKATRINDAIGIKTIFESKPKAPITMKGEPRGWQLDLYDKLFTEPDDREILVYYDPIGNTGKSWFTKYMFIKHPDKTIFLKTANQKDTATTIGEYIKDGWSGNTIILDLCRDYQERKSLYAIVEDLKNGMITSTKYKGGNFVFEIPHIVIFVNFMVDVDKLSHDRWKIYNMQKEKYISIRKCQKIRQAELADLQKPRETHADPVENDE